MTEVNTANFMIFYQICV